MHRHNHTELTCLLPAQIRVPIQQVRGQYDACQHSLQLPAQHFVPPPDTLPSHPCLPSFLPPLSLILLSFDPLPLNLNPQPGVTVQPADPRSRSCCQGPKAHTGFVHTCARRQTAPTLFIHFSPNSLLAISSFLLPCLVPLTLLEPSCSLSLSLSHTHTHTLSTFPPHPPPHYVGLQSSSVRAALDRQPLSTLQLLASVSSA